MVNEGDVAADEVNGNGNNDDQKGGRVLRWLDRAIELQQPLAAAHVERLRRRHPEKSPAELCTVLERQYLAAVTGSGAAVGAAAAAPGVGTTVAVAMSAGETVTSLEAATLFVLAVAEIHGVHLADIERRRTLLLSILLGDGGSAAVGTVAGRTGKHWARLLVDAVPMTRIQQVNKVLGPRFVTKYGTKQGILVLGRAAPFGIGAGIGAAGNAAIGYSIVRGVRHAFGDPPSGPAETGRHDAEE